MKKILSVILAIMMLFSVVSFSASARSIGVSDIKWGMNIGSGTLSSAQHTVVVLDFNGGTSLYPLVVYDVDTGFSTVEGVTGTYLYLPGCGYSLTAGSYVYLPAVSGGENLICTGWQEIKSGNTFAEGSNFVIPDDMQGQIIYLKATFQPAAPAEDTMASVLDILTKIFGTIIGIIFLDGNGAAGIELMKNMLGGLLG